MSVTKLVIATSAILAMAATLVASPESPKGSTEGADATTASIATLKANLGNPAGLAIEEVRVTDAGIACIDYRVGNTQAGTSRGHAVVQGNEVVKSSSDERFEKLWNEHCLGPRGGLAGAP
jgi:hypothetical protein